MSRRKSPIIARYVCEGAKKLTIDAYLDEFFEAYTKRFRRRVSEIEKRDGIYLDFRVSFNLSGERVIVPAATYVIERSINKGVKVVYTSHFATGRLRRKDLTIPTTSHDYAGSDRVCITEVNAEFTLFDVNYEDLSKLARELVLQTLIDTMTSIVKTHSWITVSAYILCQPNGFILSEIMDKYCKIYGCDKMFDFINMFDSLVRSRRIACAVNKDSKKGEFSIL